MMQHGHKYIIVKWEASNLTMGWASRTFTACKGVHLHCFEADTGRLVAWSKGAPHLGKDLRSVYTLNRNTHDGPLKDQMLQMVATGPIEEIYGVKLDLNPLYTGLILDSWSADNTPDGLIVDNPPTNG